MSQSLSERILVALTEAEHNELNPHFQADYRIAWITVLRAARGERLAHISATYAVLGLHPDKVWPAIVARRKALLGSYYEDFWGEKFRPVAPPRKPPQSVRHAIRKFDGRKLA
jgi:hypothetical protein